MRPLSKVSPSLAAVAALTWALAGCGSASSSSGTDPAATAERTTTADGVKHLDVKAFAALAGTPSTIVLDVRTPAEFASGHLRRASVLDFQAADFDAKLATLDKQATYAVYCRSGRRSGEALKRMQATGFTHVADLTGGITAWSQAGSPIASG